MTHFSRIGLFRLLAILLLAGGCLTDRPRPPSLAYAPDAFRQALLERVPDLPESLTPPPFLVPEEVLERTRAWVERAPRGPERVEALVRFLSLPQPEGLGLVYDWSATGNANVTLERGRGNCVSLASVLVGLGRGLGWPVYYAEARTRDPEEQSFEQVRALSDHMVVIIAPRSFKSVIDFTGRLDEVEDLRPIDDLTAYAHIVNNQAAQSLLRVDRAATDESWSVAVNGFRLATQIQPTLGRSWNNLGIALTRLGRYDEARHAYQRAVELDTAFGSAERNLAVMETRAVGATTIGNGERETVGTGQPPSDDSQGSRPADRSGSL